MVPPVRTRPPRGVTLIELLIAAVLLGILTAIAIPNVLSAQKRSQYAQAAADTKTATTQAIVYSNERNQNPGTIAALHNAGYTNIKDTDPWGQPWVYSPAFADTASPATQGEMGVCSRGPENTGDCTFPQINPETGPNGSVGYSSIYGTFQGTV